MADVPGAGKFTSPSGTELTAILLKPQPIKQDNLNLVLDAGWITKDLLCQGGATVDVCK